MGKISLANMSVVSDLTLASNENGGGVIFTDGQGLGYVATYGGRGEYPSVIVKFALSNMRRMASLDVPVSDGPVRSGFPDGTGFAYFGTDSTPARVVQIDLADMRKVGAITLRKSENKFNTGFYSSGFGYFGTYQASGYIVRVALGDLFNRSVTGIVGTLSETDYLSPIFDEEHAHSLLSATTTDLGGKEGHQLTDTISNTFTFERQTCNHSIGCWRYNLADMTIQKTASRPLLNFALLGTIGGFAGSAMSAFLFVNSQIQKRVDGVAMRSIGAKGEDLVEIDGTTPEIKRSRSRVVDTEVQKGLHEHGEV